MLGNKTRTSGRISGLYRRTPAIAVVVGLVLMSLPSAHAAQRTVPRIESFGPYHLGMTLDKATAAHEGAKLGDCGEIAPERQCLVLKAAVFEEPAVIYAVLDQSKAKVERIVAQLAPELTRRRGYRCIRLSEKVFSLLVVVYGGKYKQSYDQNRRPLPAVAWDGEQAGRLIFEAKCETQDEGKPQISVIERYPDGVKPPAVAAADSKAPTVPAQPSAPVPAPATVDATATAGAAPLSVGDRRGEPQGAVGPSRGEPSAPLSAPIGVVEALASSAPETGGAAARGTGMANLTRELAHAKGKSEPAPRETTPNVVSPPDQPLIGTELRGIPEPPIATAGPAQPAAEIVYPEGKHIVPVDIIPPSADTTVAEGAASGPAAANPVPVAAVDPGPVTLLAPSVPATAPVTDFKSAPGSAPEPVSGRASSRQARSAVASVNPTAPDALARINRGPEITPPTAPVRDSLQPAGQPAIPDSSSAPAGPSTVAPAGSRPLPRPQSQQTAALTREVRAPSYREAGEPPEPSDMEAPEPFGVPEEEATFRRQRDLPETGRKSAPTNTATNTIEAEIKRRLAAATAPAPTEPTEVRTVDRGRAAAAPFSLLSAAPGDQVRGTVDDTLSRAASGGESRAPAPLSGPASAPGATSGKTPPVSAPPGSSALASDRDKAAPPAPRDTANAPAAPAPSEGEKSAEPPLSERKTAAWGNAEKRGFAPVMSGGWRHRAPVPPAKPWREREGA